MQISNASVPFPNAVAPFSPKIDPPSSGVTKDVLVSSFSPLSESQPLASSQNSLSEKVIVYSPQSLVQSPPKATVAVSPSVPSTKKSDSSSDQVSEPVLGKSAVGNSSVGESSPDNQQETPDAGNVVVQPGEGRTAGGTDIISGNDGRETPSATEINPSTNGASGQTTSSGGLTADERAIVGELAARDREVRTHEQQHQSVGGQYAGSASFAYQTGPDGVQYAVGGEVSIDISAVPNNPQATIEKMRTVKNAALAPAEPSAQDRSVAASANKLMLQAQAELAAQRAEEFQTIRAETQQRQAESLEEREQQQETQESRRPSVADGVRTYESLIALGQRYENGLAPEINLNETV